MEHNGEQSSPRISAADLTAEIASFSPEDAADILESVADEVVVDVLQSMNPAMAQDILEELDPARVDAVMSAASPQQRRQWLRNLSYPDETVGRLMEPPLTSLGPDTTTSEATERVRELSKSMLVTYLYVVDDGDRLLGVVTMRDLLLVERPARLEEVMLREPFSLSPELKLPDAMKLVVSRHFPVYPVCDESGVLIGLVRGHALFEEQAYEISAQPGRMVGVDKEERTSTAWNRSLRLRHPWLQLNLLTAFVAAFVVGQFQATIDRIVILAVFLPVLAGQSGNTGCQALAVALRGLTLGELGSGRERVLVLKEGLLGLINGALIGVTAGLAMFLAASMQSNPHSALLGFIVFVAMTVSCVISGAAGALIPMTFRRFGADPATASSIFLTTASDVVSMGVFLLLATILVK